MFKLTIAEAEDIVYEGEVEILNIYTSHGQMGILENHVPFVDTVIASEMSFVDKDGKKHILATSGGWLFVWQKEVTVLVNASEFDFQIDVDKAQKFKEEAELELQNTDLDEIQAVHARAKLEKAINRINVAQKK